MKINILSNLSHGAVDFTPVQSVILLSDGCELEREVPCMLLVVIHLPSASVLITYTRLPDP